MEADGGRSEVLGAARCALLSTGRVVVVGTGGIGKTTIVRRLVEELPSDEVVWLEMDHVGDPDQAETMLLDGIAERTTAASAAELVRLSTEDRRVVIVVDGADSLIDTVLDVTEAVPVSPDGPWVVVASRVHPMGASWTTVRVGPLESRPEDVHSFPMALFEEWFVSAGGLLATLDAQREAVVRLVESAAGIPLALRVTAATAAAVGLDATEAMVAEGDRMETLSASLARGLDALEPSARRLFDAMAVTSGRIDLDSAAMIADLPIEEARGAIGALLRHHLLDETGDEYRMLPPVHRFAIGRTGACHDPEAVTRHLSWCQAHDVGGMLRHEADVRLAIERSLPTDVDAADALVRRLAFSQMMALRQHQACELLDDMLGRPEFAASAGCDRRIELLRLSAIAHGDSQGVGWAFRLLDEAEALVPCADDPERATAWLASTRASFERDVGSLDDAEVLARRAAAAAARSDDVKNRLLTDCYLAEILRDLGRLDEADALAVGVLKRNGGWHELSESKAQYTRALIAVERADRAYCAAVARRRLATSSTVGGLIEAEFLLMLADPLAHAGMIEMSIHADRALPGEWTVYLAAQATLTMRALVESDVATAMTLASDIVVVAEMVPIAWLQLEGLRLLADAANMAGDHHQARVTHRRALLFANEHGFVLRTADALDGLVPFVANTELRNAVVACAAQIRAASGAFPRSRSWASAPEAPGERASDAPPPGWLTGSTLTPMAIDAVFASTQLAPESESPSVGHLSPAELRVARLVAEGCSNRSIGERLHISRRTVETHVVHAFQKLGVQNRTQLATAIHRSLSD